MYIPVFGTNCDWFGFGKFGFFVFIEIDKHRKIADVTSHEASRFNR